MIQSNVSDRVLWVLCIVVLLQPATLFAQDIARYEALARPPKRHALVIGNPTYDHLAELPSAATDARRTADSLRKLGFQVVLETSLPSRRVFEDVILPTFRRDIQPGDLVVFYYSGHGFSYGASTFLAPKDLTHQLRDRRVDRVAIAVESVESALADADPGMIVMLIDACRTIPNFQVVDSAGRNLVEKSLPPPPQTNPDINVLLGYASRPGRPALAYATAGVLSPYTHSLLKYIGQVDKEFTASYQDVMQDVRESTGGEQFPGIFVYSVASLYLKPTTARHHEERQILRVALRSGKRQLVKKFLDRYSTSPFAASARAWLEDNRTQAPSQDYSVLSPAVIERAWHRENAIAFLPLMGFGYAREVDAGDVLSVSALNDSALGLSTVGSARIDSLAARTGAEVAALLAHGRVFTTRSFEAYRGPSQSAGRLTSLPPGTVLDLDAAAGAASSWIRASAPGIRGVFFVEALPTGGTLQTVALGGRISDIVLGSPSRGPRELVDSAVVLSALAQARERGQISSVSLTTSPATNPEESWIREMRLAHVEAILRRAGIERRQITSIAAAQELTGDNVRMRFLGTLSVAIR